MSISLLFLLCFVSLISTSLACTCAVRPTVYSVSLLQPNLLRVKVVGGSMASGAYKVFVQNVYEGCTTPNTTVAIATPQFASECGVELSIGRSYVVSAYDGPSGSLKTDSCSLNQPFSTLTPVEQRFLSNTYNTCTGQCNTGGIVNCLVQPCATVACPVANATCFDNFCNGCHAYWFENFQRVCLPNSVNLN
eukprot:TRINITY_DN1906_c0_g1_i1.p1 TRINITY_DN1906_c0_g1~~TRINITY_DN1906_c0_g1_i1.p1  ORF type:complete len:215 (+),score=61.48 TRINITY_DN1906_c0_g1_i1:71-646(+)